MLRWTFWPCSRRWAQLTRGVYEFLAAPEIDLNRVYRARQGHGRVGACQYGLKDGGRSASLCVIGPGEGAGAQPPSDYGTGVSRHEKEGGVFRVDQRTGAMSICYVLNDLVVCTPPAK